MSDLVQSIRLAFPSGNPPGRPITSQRCDECDEVDKLLGGRAWLDAADDFPFYCHDAFPLLTAAAMAYYLPTYMCLAIEDPSCMAAISVTAALDDKRIVPVTFTEQQRESIRQWASIMLQCEPSKLQATVRRWS